MNPSERQELPEPVKQAMHHNRKIEAIKLLRESDGLGLKEAKHAVEAYAREHPERIQQIQRSSGATALLLIAATAVLAYGIYRLIQ